MSAIPIMATINPRKKFSFSFPSDFKKMLAKITVKIGEIDTITPTLDAMVRFRAIFSIK